LIGQITAIPEAAASTVNKDDGGIWSVTRRWRWLVDIEQEFLPFYLTIDNGGWWVNFRGILRERQTAAKQDNN
jgi:hypothetical protein